MYSTVPNVQHLNHLNLHKVTFCTSTKGLDGPCRGHNLYAVQETIPFEATVQEISNERTPLNGPRKTPEYLIARSQLTKVRSVGKVPFNFSWTSTLRIQLCPKKESTPIQSYSVDGFLQNIDPKSEFHSFEAGIQKKS